MKHKKINKKLVLNKNTISNLDSNGMNKVYGGDPVTYEYTVCFTGCATGCIQCPTIMPSRCPILC